MFTNRVEKLASKIQSLTEDKIRLKNQLRSSQVENKSLKDNCALLRKEKCKLSEEKNEIEILLRESQCYGKTLRSHVDELEVCYLFS